MIVSLEDHDKRRDQQNRNDPRSRAGSRCMRPPRLVVPVTRTRPAFDAAYDDYAVRNARPHCRTVRLTVATNLSTHHVMLDAGPIFRLDNAAGTDIPSIDFPVRPEQIPLLSGPWRRRRRQRSPTRCTKPRSSAADRAREAPRMDSPDRRPRPGRLRGPGCGSTRAVRSSGSPSI